VVVTTTTNAGQRGTAGLVRGTGSPRAEEVGGQRGQDRGGGGDQAGQPDGAVDVGGPGWRAVAEGAPALGLALVEVGAAEAHPERPGERGLAAAGVRARVRGPVAAHGAQGSAPAPAGQRGQGHGQGGGQPGRYQVRHIVETGGGPAEPFVTHAVMADHRVQRVHRPVAEQAACAGHRAPQQRRHHGVAGVLRHRLHRRAGQFGRGKPGGVAAAQRREPAARGVEVAGRQRAGECRRLGGQAGTAEHRPGRRRGERRTGQRAAPGQPLPGPAGGGHGTGAGHSEQRAAGPAGRPEPPLGAGRGGAEGGDRVAAARVGEQGVEGGAEQQAGGEPGPVPHQRRRGGRGSAGRARRPVKGEGEAGGAPGGADGDFMAGLPRGNHAPGEKDRRPECPGSRIEAPLSLPTAARSWLT
jgi:hypothetical protein